MFKHLCRHQVQLPLTDSLDLAADAQIKAMFLQIADARPACTAIALKSMNYSTIPVHTPLELNKSCTAAATQFCRPDRLWRISHVLVLFSVFIDYSCWSRCQNLLASLPHFFRNQWFKIPFHIDVAAFIQIFDTLLRQIAVTMGFIIANASLICCIVQDPTHLGSVPRNMTSRIQPSKTI